LKVFLFIPCQFQFRHGIDAFAKFIGEAGRKKMFATVDELVFYFLVGEKFNNGILHGDFIKIIVEDGS
jgi:hypothetical protein